MLRRACLLAVCLAAPQYAAAQPPPTDQRPAAAPDAAPDPRSVPLSAVAYTPATNDDRIHWIVDGTIGVTSLGVGVIASLWQTGFNTPEEWGQTPRGFGQRYFEREADVAISNSIEAGVGAIWGEDPRYIPSGRHGIRPRIKYALKTAFVAQRRDGRLAPAWGRYAGNTLNNLIENTWLPSSVTTPAQTALRSVEGMGSRILGNLWQEFWPEAVKRLRK